MYNSKGSALIAVLSFAIIFNIVFLAVYFAVTSTQKSTGIKRVKTSALMLAEAGKEKLYGEIAHKIFVPQNGVRLSAYTDFPLNKGTFSVSCSSNTTLDTAWVSSAGKDNSLLAQINVVASIEPDIDLANPHVRGAVNARSRIIVKGNINIDGRDHDTNGVYIGKGVFGVSTCDSLFLSGSATVGGNDTAPVSDKDIAPVKSIVSEELAPVTAAFGSPEAFLGLPPGALDKYKVSTLTTPMHGIVYLTDSYVGPVHFDSSYGILIVHNSLKNAQLQINNGNFKGIIIADLMAKITGNAEIIGAVVTLHEGEVSTFGTGTVDIYYSSYVMNNLAKYCQNVQKKVKEISWEEVKK
jgi:hypothetical protein